MEKLVEFAIPEQVEAYDHSRTTTMWSYCVCGEKAVVDIGQAYLHDPLSLCREHALVLLAELTQSLS